MSSHDYLMIQLEKVEQLLKEFCDEHRPHFAEKSKLLMRKTIQLVHAMPLKQLEEQTGEKQLYLWEQPNEAE